MSTKKGGSPSVPAAATMRENYQRIGSGLGYGVSDSHLTAQGAARRKFERVLGSRCNILACMLGSRGIPYFTRKPAIPCCVQWLDSTDTDRKSTADERIVFGRLRCPRLFRVLFRVANSFHQ